MAELWNIRAIDRNKEAMRRGGGSSQSVCRTCLAPGRLQPIFPEEPGAMDYSELIITYSGIELAKDDGLPQKMCFACLHLLKSAAYFRKIARQSDEKLRATSQQSILQQNDLSTIGIENIKTETVSRTISADAPFEGSSDGELSADDTSESDSDLSTEVPKSEMVDCDNSPKDPDEDRKLSDLVKEKKNNNRNKSVEKRILLQNLIKNIRNKPKTVKSEAWTDLEKIIKSEPKIINRGDKEWRRRVRAIFRIEGASSARRIECRLCGIVLKQSSSMHVHAQKHLGYRVICESCGKGFPNNCALQQHCMNRHGLKKSFSCAHCPFTSAVRFEMTVHERTHTGERPFVCDTCGSSFFRRRCLIVHTRSHAGTRPYKCTNCDKRFISRGDMMSHHNAVHVRRYVFPCPVCGQRYARRTTVYKHIAAQHDAHVDRKAVTKIFL